MDQQKEEHLKSASEGVEERKPIIMRVTDRNWSDGLFHDRLHLYRANEDQLYLLEGKIRIGQNPGAPWHDVIAGVAREHQHSKSITLMARHPKSGKWVKIGEGVETDEKHYEFTLNDAASTNMLAVLVRPFSLPSGPAVTANEDSVEKLDIDIQSADQRRAGFKVVS